jgi:hypothetical protein
MRKSAGSACYIHSVLQPKADVNGLFYRCFSPLFATFSPLFTSEIKRGEKVDMIRVFE